MSEEFPSASPPPPRPPSLPASDYSPPPGFSRPSFSHPPPPSNALGLTGFILSMCGLLCGVLFPIGLIVSLIGLRKQPRGFAIAGSITGALGTCLTAAAVVFYIFIISESLNESTARMQTEVQIDNASLDINRYMIDHDGRLPDKATGTRLIAGMRDGWDKPLRYERDGGVLEDFVIRSAGPDGRFDTFDDLTSDNMYYDDRDFLFDD